MRGAEREEPVTLSEAKGTMPAFGPFTPFRVTTRAIHMTMRAAR